MNRNSLLLALMVLGACGTKEQQRRTRELPAPDSAILSREKTVMMTTEAGFMSGVYGALVEIPDHVTALSGSFGKNEVVELVVGEGRITCSYKAPKYVAQDEVERLEAYQVDCDSSLIQLLPFEEIRLVLKEKSKVGEAEIELGIRDFLKK